MVFGFGERRRKEIEVTSRAFKQLGKEEKVVKRIEKLGKEEDSEKLQRFIELRKEESFKQRRKEVPWQEQVKKRLSSFEQRRPVEDFTNEEKTLRGMFGHGEKMWGNIREPVHINNDLNPRQRGDTGTAEMFGF